ncbi:aminotransferase class I/II-fold pyridoxal phosphate-dependent enzyme, partial [Lysinibacillus sp. D4B1_S16]|uniref:aminotransferase class I/II-fold pyridoxal phosphate-dependent enzyme n=1 Tax=Lysinibacillus sp. D4B1_S16 TaxID=2941231 RepID=UPI0020BD4923
PTFSEKERTLRAAGAFIIPILVTDFIQYTLPMERLKQEMMEADALYICTPNNPTGVLPEKKDLLALLEHGRAVKCELVIGEAFM